jgi:hypothetical protein
MKRLKEPPKNLLRNCAVQLRYTLQLKACQVPVCSIISIEFKMTGIKWSGEETAALIVFAS